MELIISYGRSKGTTQILTPLSQESQKKASLREVVASIEDECQKIIRSPSLFCTNHKLTYCVDWKDKITTIKKIQSDLSDAKYAITSLKAKLIQKRGELSFFNFFSSLAKWASYTIHIHTLEKAYKNLAKHNEVGLPEHRKCETTLDYLYLLRAIGYGHNQKLAEFMETNQQKPLTLSNELKLFAREEDAFNDLVIKFIKKTYPETYQIAFNAYQISETSLITPSQLEKTLATLKTGHKLSESDIDALLTEQGFKDYLSPAEFANLKAKFLREKFCLESAGSSLKSELDHALFQRVCEKLTGKEYAEMGARSMGMHYHLRPIKTVERANQLLRNLGYKDSSMSRELANYLIRANLHLTCYAHPVSKQEIRAFNQIVVSFMQERAPIRSFYAIEALLESFETPIPETVLNTPMGNEISETLFDPRFEKLIQNLNLKDILSPEEQSALKLHLRKMVVELKEDGTFRSDLNKKQFVDIFLQFLTQTFPEKEELLARIIHLKNLTGKTQSIAALLKRCKDHSLFSDSSLTSLLSAFGFNESLPIYHDFKKFMNTSFYSVKDLKKISAEEKNEFSYLCYSFLIKTYPQRRQKLLASLQKFLSTNQEGKRAVTSTSLQTAFEKLAPVSTSMSAWLGRNLV
ncbi:MAG: hypothetical protein FJZ59_03420 [Chlamydiae bacterium]|nr:hypothetical protein [Chlamydiota bacterium]